MFQKNHVIRKIWVSQHSCHFVNVQIKGKLDVNDWRHWKNQFLLKAWESKPVSQLVALRDGKRTRLMLCEYMAKNEPMNAMNPEVLY